MDIQICHKLLSSSFVKTRYFEKNLESHVVGIFFLLEIPDCLFFLVSVVDKYWHIWKYKKLLLWLFKKKKEKNNWEKYINGSKTSSRLHILLSDLVFRYVGYENSEDRKIKSLVLKGCDASFLPDLIRDKLNLCSWLL